MQYFPFMSKLVCRSGCIRAELDGSLASASFVMAFSDFDGGSGGGGSSPAVSSGIVTSKKASATGGSTASADGDDSGSTASSASGAASPSGSSKGGGTGSAQYVQGSSCQIKMDSPCKLFAPLSRYDH